MKNLLAVISPGTIISQLITGCLAFYILVSDNILNCSISSIIAYAHTLEVTQHLIVLGMLPIYIAAVIFGAATLGVYLGTRVERAILRSARQKKSKISCQSR